MGQFGIGQPVRRFEDKRLLTGFGRFQHDVDLPGQAHGYVLRSPHAHARIRAIDLAAARAAPGVLAIYTGEDLATAGLGTMGVPFQRKRPDGSPMFWRAHRGLAEGRVRYVGEPIAFVVAETAAAGARCRRADRHRLRSPAVGHRHGARPPRGKSRSGTNAPTTSRTCSRPATRQRPTPPSPAPRTSSSAAM